jgi:hypothetical protein
MNPPPILVIAEAASLGTAVVDLLVADGLEVERVDALAPEVATRPEAAGPLPEVVVSVPGNRPSGTYRSWAKGPYRGVPLVIVGTRPAEPVSNDLVHLVTLPLSPQGFLRLVRRLAGLPEPTSPPPRGDRESGAHPLT